MHRRENAGDFKIHFSTYDGNGKEQKAVFAVKVDGENGQRKQGDFIMKRAGVLPEKRGFKSVCDGSGRILLSKRIFVIRFATRLKQAACDSKSWRPLWLLKINQF